MGRFKLYIPTFKEGTKQCTLLNAEKFNGLREILPSQEALRTHMQIQHIKIQKDADYKPEPLVLRMEKEKFNAVYSSIKGHQVKKDAICLVTAWPAVPICIIYSD